jgi:DNA-binding GntR family transcriptional regulator
VLNRGGVVPKLNVQRIVKRSVEMQAADSLRAAVITGTIPLGSRITETQLSVEMGLSRASIRAALHQLSMEGLTTLVPYTGWAVVSFSSSDIWELYTLRSSLERLAARLLAATLDEKKAGKLKQVDEHLKSVCNSGNRNEIADADFALHKAIVALACHGRLEGQYEKIECQIRLYINSSNSLIDETATIYEQHHPIIEAILGKDVERAGLLAEGHNVCEGQKLCSHLFNLEQGTKQGSVSPKRLKNLSPRKSSRATSNRNARPAKLKRHRGRAKASS